ncbi:MAG TPA: hypothetical protein VFA86_11945 [Gammaproteobacteria bacterium]|nr:hypothetical protein [Gammaproteobacteria bacterium]
MTDTRLRNPGELLATLVALAAASVSPLIFVAAAAGYSSMHDLGMHALIPALAVWFAIAVLSRPMGWSRLGRGLAIGFLAGIAATVALEIVRITGFRAFDSMPGSMPELMGVLLTNHFMLGPDLWSNVVGWADHFANGVGFATIFVLVFGRPRAWTAIPYTLAIAVVFMSSPVVRVMGAGYFGANYDPGFVVTVLLAHIAFALALGNVVARGPALQGPIWRHYLVPARQAGTGVA